MFGNVCSVFKLPMCIHLGVHVLYTRTVYTKYTYSIHYTYYIH